MARLTNRNIIAITVLILLFVGLGYAFLTTTLSINGTTDVDANTWNVYWEYFGANPNLPSGTQVVQAPTIDTNKTTVSFRIRLSEPGDYYEFAVAAKNDGTIDAMIDTITKTNNLPNYVLFTVAYPDESDLEENQILRAGTEELYFVRVKYRDDISPSDLPNTAQTLNLSFGVNYVQADSNAIEVKRIVYEKNNDYITVGDNMNYDLTNYSYQHLIGELDPFFLRFELSNQTVENIKIGLYRNNNIYYFQGGGATYNETDNEYNNDSPYYYSNIEEAKRAFGEDNCYITRGSNSDTYCDGDDFRLYILKNGKVSIERRSSPYYGCITNEDGSSMCY